MILEYVNILTAFSLYLKISDGPYSVLLFWDYSNYSEYNKEPYPSDPLFQTTPFSKVQ